MKKIWTAILILSVLGGTALGLFTYHTLSNADYFSDCYDCGMQPVRFEGWYLLFTILFFLYLTFVIMDIEEYLEDR